jgi:hypothetical protein
MSTTPGDGTSRILKFSRSASEGALRLARIATVRSMVGDDEPRRLQNRQVRGFRALKDANLGSLLGSHVMRMMIAPPNREPSRTFYTDRSRERLLRNAIVARSDAPGDPVVVPKDRSATKFRRWKQTTTCRPSNSCPKEAVPLHWDRHSWQSSSSKPEGYLKSRGPYT